MSDKEVEMNAIELDIAINKAYVTQDGHLVVPQKNSINALLIQNEAVKKLFSMWLKNRINHSAMRRGKEPYYFDKQGKPY